MLRGHLVRHRIHGSARPRPRPRAVRPRKEAARPARPPRRQRAQDVRGLLGWSRGIARGRATKRQLNVNGSDATTIGAAADGASRGQRRSDKHEQEAPAASLVRARGGGLPSIRHDHGLVPEPERNNVESHRSATSRADQDQREQHTNLRKGKQPETRCNTQVTRHNKDDQRTDTQGLSIRGKCIKASLNVHFAP